MKTVNDKKVAERQRPGRKPRDPNGVHVVAMRLGELEYMAWQAIGGTEWLRAYLKSFVNDPNGTGPV